MNIVMVAGEASGDLLGGKLAKELYNSGKVNKISGIGGEAMRQSNVETLHDVSETSVVGIAEVLKHYPRLLKILANTKKLIRNSRPELVILIDYPEFNLKLAKFAKSLNIKVLFYVSPQVWAWRSHRVKKIKARIDLMAVLFPFEVTFYQKANIPVCLIKHPMLEDVDKYFCEPASNKKTLTIGLAPGSRENEINKLYPVMLNAAFQLKHAYKNIEFIVPIASSVNQSQLEDLNTQGLAVKYNDKSFYQAINKCDVIAISSGTATLQAALMNKAMVVVYKISPLTYKLFGHMVKVDHISLANIILNRRAYPELLQDKANSENLFDQLDQLIKDKNREKTMNANRKEIYKKLNSGLSSKELADKAIALAIEP